MGQPVNSGEAKMRLVEQRALSTFFDLDAFIRNDAYYRCVDCNLTGLLHPNNRPVIAGKLALDRKQLLTGLFSVKRITHRREYLDELIFTIRSLKEARNRVFTKGEGRNDSKWDYVEIYFPTDHVKTLLKHIVDELVFHE